MSELRALIVEDEPEARRMLAMLIARQGDIRVVGECSDGLQAVERIVRLQPELVFLDVKIPELDGFGVIERVGAEKMPTTIFVTGFDGFAVRAFDVHALDYLVKPFSNARFEATIARARRRLAERRAAEGARRPRAMLDATRAPAGEGPRLNRFVIKLGERRSIISAPDVDWIEAQAYYAILHVGAAAHLHRETLHALDAGRGPRGRAEEERRQHGDEARAEGGRLPREGLAARRSAPSTWRGRAHGSAW